MSSCNDHSSEARTSHGTSSLSTGVRLLATGLVLCAGLLAGCEREETLLEIETPDGGVEVQRNIDSGKIDVEVED